MLSYYEVVSYSKYNRLAGAKEYRIMEYLPETDKYTLDNSDIGSAGIFVSLHEILTALKEGKMYISSGITKLRSTVYKDEITEIEKKVAQDRLKFNMLYPNATKTECYTLAEKGLFLYYFLFGTDFFTKSIHPDEKMLTILANKDFYLDRILIEDVISVLGLIAKKGYALDRLVYYPSPFIKTIVAKQGFGLDILVKDNSEDVLKEVVRQHYSIDRLYKHPSPVIRQEVAKEGFYLNELLLDKTAIVRKAAMQALNGTLRKEMRANDRKEMVLCEDYNTTYWERRYCSGCEYNPINAESEE